jgi:hypothetical protein
MNEEDLKLMAALDASIERTREEINKRHEDKVRMEQNLITRIAIKTAIKNLVETYGAAAVKDALGWED